MEAAKAVATAVMAELVEAAEVVGEEKDWGAEATATVAGETEGAVADEEVAAAREVAAKEVEMEVPAAPAAA